VEEEGELAVQLLLPIPVAASKLRADTLEPLQRVGQRSALAELRVELELVDLAP
jgi:hypothetical protein